MSFLAFFLVALQVLVAAPDDEREILRLEETLKNAWLRHDTATIADIVAEDFQFWSFRAQRRGKADLLGAVAKSDETETGVENAAVRIYGDTAIYTARLTDIGTHSDGQSYRTRSCLTAVFVRRAGKWQLVSEHQTIIPDAPKS